MVISKASPEQQQQLKEEAQKSEWDEIENMIGFSKVLNKITQSVILQLKLPYYLSNESSLMMNINFVGKISGWP